MLLSNASNAEPPLSFFKSKKLLNSKIYYDQKTSFYCGCSYKAIEITNNNGKKRKKESVDHASCGYEPRKNEMRAAYIEWEHIMPAWAFGHQRQCWQDGKRPNCTKNDPLFKEIEADLHNLVPAIGEANGDRSNFRYGMIEGEPRNYGACDFEVDFKRKITEPTESIRGDIARIYFYMRDQYNLRLSEQQTKLFTAWNKLDPVSDWECEKDKRIKAIQTNSNLYVQRYCPA